VTETERIGIFGARSLVGAAVIDQRTAAEQPTLALSRRVTTPADEAGVGWAPVAPPPPSAPKPVPTWLSLAPIWGLVEHWSVLEAYGVGQLIAVSSSSVVTKWRAPSRGDRALARRLAEAEATVRARAAARGVACTILRPTLIYGCGRDQNICRIARVIRRFGVFPVTGGGTGLRQPIHAADLAALLLSLVATPARCTAGEDALTVGGGERLSYRAMVRRIAAADGRSVRLLPLPVWLTHSALSVLARRTGTIDAALGVAARMTDDLTADNQAVDATVGFRPRGFAPAPEDMPAASSESNPHAERRVPS